MAHSHAVSAHGAGLAPVHRSRRGRPSHLCCVPPSGERWGASPRSPQHRVHLLGTPAGLPAVRGFGGSGQNATESRRASPFQRYARGSGHGLAGTSAWSQGGHAARPDQPGGVFIGPDASGSRCRPQPLGREDKPCRLPAPDAGGGDDFGRHPHTGHAPDVGRAVREKRTPRPGLVDRSDGAGNVIGRR